MQIIFIGGQQKTGKNRGLSIEMHLMIKIYCDLHKYGLFVQRLQDPHNKYGGFQEHI